LYFRRISSIRLSRAFLRVPPTYFPSKASMRTAMANLPAMARAIFPLCHFSASWINACWKIKPCLGGLAPVFMARNRAFSAPRTCMVLAGLRARFCKPPAMAIILAPSNAPTMALVLGATSSIVLSRYDSIPSRTLYISSTLLQTA
jgi:hypothetical protein